MADARSAASRISALVARRFTKFGGDAKRRLPHTWDATRMEQTYGAIQGMFRQAENRMTPRELTRSVRPSKTSDDTQPGRLTC